MYKNAGAAGASQAGRRSAGRRRSWWTAGDLDGRGVERRRDRRGSGRGGEEVIGSATSGWLRSHFQFQIPCHGALLSSRLVIRGVSRGNQARLSGDSPVAITRTSIRGTRSRVVCTGASRRRTRRSSIPIGVAPTTRGAKRRRTGDTTFEFTGFDFSAAAHGPQAATFTELFAEVLHPVAVARPRTAAAGRRHPRGADSISFEDSMHGVERQVVVDAAGRVRRVRRRRVRCARRRVGARRATAAAKCAGRAATWCSRRVARRATAPAASGSQRCGACAGHGLHVRSEGVPVAHPAGRRTTARGYGSRESRPRRAARRHGTATSTSPSTCSRTRCSAARVTISTWCCRSACTTRCSGRASTCRRSRVR